ncbi:MAG: APC family permease [Candidatus Dormibacteraceae bacterium]
MSDVTEGRRRYRKELGLWSIVFLATGAILGPAVGFTPVDVLGFAGPAGIFAWMIAFLLVLTVAMCYVELGTMWPRAGGVAYYPARSSGPLVGVLNAWGSFIGYSLAVPSIIVAFVEYVSYWVPQLFQNGALSAFGILVSLAVVAALFGINVLRIRYLGQINNVLTVLTILGLVIVIVALLTRFHLANFSHFGGVLPLGASGLFLAVSATIYGFGGFRQPIDYAEEVRDPGRTIPIAVVMTMFITLAIFCLESFSFTGAIDWAAMKLPSGAWDKLNGLAYPFVTVAQGGGLAFIALVALVTTLIASFKDGYIYYGGASRVGHTLARYDRFLPTIFTRMSTHGIPIASVLLVLIVSFIYLLLLPAFSSLFPLVASALVLSYAPGPLAVAIFRTKNPEEHRPYRLPLYKVLCPWAFVVASVLVYWSGWHAVRILIPSVAVGMLLLFFYARARRITRDDIVYGIWMPAYLAVIVIVSWLGGSAFGGTNVIPFPWDTVVFAVIALIFYYIGLTCGIRWKGVGIFEEAAAPAEVPAPGGTAAETTLDPSSEAQPES